MAIESWLAMVNGHIARSWYCGWVPPIGGEITREVISPPLVQKLRELTQLASLAGHKTGES